jgi:hypothetical protein
MAAPSISDAIREVSAGHASRICAPGIWCVRRENGALVIERKRGAQS